MEKGIEVNAIKVRMKPEQRKFSEGLNMHHATMKKVGLDVSRWPTLKMLAAYMIAHQNGIDVESLKGLKVAEEAGTLYFLSNDEYDKLMDAVQPCCRQGKVHSFTIKPEWLLIIVPALLLGMVLLTL